MEDIEEYNTTSEEQRRKYQEALDSMGVQYQSEFTVNETYRRNKEIEWIEDLRQAKGVYDPTITALIPPNASSVYPKYTRSKEIPCVAKLNNMLFPSNDRNWDVASTPVPKLPNEIIQQITMSLMSRDEQGNIVPPTTQQVMLAITQYAKARCAEARNIMDDQLTEIGKTEIDKKVIRSAVRLGTGVFKGPITRKKVENQLEKDGYGNYAIGQKETFAPEAEFLPIWYWYPDMSTTDVEQCDFFWELHPMTKQELKKLVNRQDFRGDVIKQYIKDYPDGDYKMKQWELDLLAVKDETTKIPSRKYEVRERWGYTEGATLKAAYEFSGLSLPEGFDEDEDYWGNVWTVGNKVIKAVLNPLPDDPMTKTISTIYNVFYFEKDETSIFGSGLPRAIKDSDITIAAATRAMLDNAAITVGSIYEANKDLLTPEEIETIEDMHANKVILREGMGSEANYPAIRALNTPSHISEYIQIISLFEGFGDKESTMPSFLWGEDAGTSQKTARESSIQHSNTNITVGDIVKNFDTCNEKFLRALYAFNMQYNEDFPKGDMVIKAMGSSSLLTKELRIQALDNFAAQLKPEDAPHIKRNALLRTRAKMHDLDPDEIIYTEAEAQQNMQSMRDAEAEALQKQSLELENKYVDSKAEHMYAKARATDDKVKLDAVNTIHNVTKENKGGGERKAV